ncbi:hypothetical protein OM416_02380 [Paenibacillus sp. LS1]|nr:hypothetical protein [Paenibacillus sp. LS1]
MSPSSENLLKGIIAGAYEIEAEIEIPEASTVTEFGFNIREGANQKPVDLDLRSWKFKSLF